MVWLPRTTGIRLSCGSPRRDRPRGPTLTRPLDADDFRSLVEGSPDPLAVVDAGALLRYGSPALAGVLGYGSDDLHGKSALDFVHPEDVDAVRADIEAALAGREPPPHDVRVRGRDGGWRTFDTISRRFVDKGGGAGVAFHCRDVSLRAAGEAYVRYQATHDPLTGLANRASFVERLERTLGRARHRPNHVFAVLLVDVDRIKLVNEGYGHVVGDELLSGVARRLLATVRPGDLVARVGGDEFAVLLEPVHGPEDAAHVARRIHAALAPPIRLEAVEVFPTVSIGIALSVTGYERTEDVLRDADTAMHRARKAGIGRTEVFDRSMHARAMAKMRLEAELRRAIERDELRVHYQPIVSLADGRIAGFEALVRWQHPEQGLVPPALFIPAAEETGLIVPLCAWVLRRACRQVRAWQDGFEADPPLSMSINFTSSHFTHPDVVSAVVGSLEEAHLEGRQLVMEVTESVLLADVEAVVSVFRALKSLEIELHLDDFGTGYSSLNYLHRLPTDAVKIDRSFVGGMAREDGSEVMVRAIVELAHNLGRRVVAEGVETHDQLSALRALECEHAQGYLFSRPLEADAASALLASPPRW